LFDLLLTLCIEEEQIQRGGFNGGMMPDARLAVNNH
jgi:hypothetical protein